ncbi:MAG: hypothetical protein ACK51N_04670 [bacterium]|jgi:hypothetical protein
MKMQVRELLDRKLNHVPLTVRTTFAVDSMFCRCRKHVDGMDRSLVLEKMELACMPPGPMSSVALWPVRAVSDECHRAFERDLRGIIYAPGRQHTPLYAEKCWLWTGRPEYTASLDRVTEPRRDVRDCTVCGRQVVGGRRGIKLVVPDTVLRDKVPVFLDECGDVFVVQEWLGMDKGALKALGLMMVNCAH